MGEFLNGGVVPRRGRNDAGPLVLQRDRVLLAKCREEQLVVRHDEELEVGVIDLVVEVEIGEAGEGRDVRLARGEEQASGEGGRGTAELQSEQPPGLTASNPKSL
ncbi:MAG: hypothetical protein ACK58T_29485 [Phycisphaerae bacterium]|jgi:hypothetical protein